MVNGRRGGKGGSRTAGWGLVRDRVAGELSGIEGEKGCWHRVSGPGRQMTTCQDPAWGEPPHNLDSFRMGRQSTDESRLNEGSDPTTAEPFIESNLNSGVPRMCDPGSGPSAGSSRPRGTAGRCSDCDSKLRKRRCRYLNAPLLYRVHLRDSVGTEKTPNDQSRGSGPHPGRRGDDCFAASG